MTESKKYRNAEISEIIVDTMPLRGQCLIALDNQTYLLSISAFVGEKGLCKLWIQGRDAIKVDGAGPVEKFNQLVYHARVMDSTPSVKLSERNGYPSIKRGEEIEFLGRLLTKGSQDWFDEDRQTWGEWIGL